MNGFSFDTAALMRRTRKYHFRTHTAKMLFVICLAVAVIVLILSHRRQSQCRELSKPVKIAILAAFMAMNVGVVIIDGMLAE